MHDFHKDFVLQKEVTATAHCTKMAKGAFANFCLERFDFVCFLNIFFGENAVFAPSPFWLLKISHLL